MQGEGYFILLYEFSGAAALLFICAIVLQRVRMYKLESELDDLTLKFQQQSAGPKHIAHELFDLCPYPMCSVDLTGDVLAYNDTFHKLVRTKIDGLNDFDTLFGTTLQENLGSGQRHIQKHITLNLKNTGRTRQFHVVVWPIAGIHSTVGYMLAFHEQTFVAKYFFFVVIHFSCCFCSLVRTQTQCAAATSGAGARRFHPPAPRPCD